MGVGFHFDAKLRPCTKIIISVVINKFLYLRGHYTHTHTHTLMYISIGYLKEKAT